MGQYIRRFVIVLTDFFAGKVKRHPGCSYRLTFAVGAVSRCSISHFHHSYLRPDDLNTQVFPAESGKGSAFKT
jgi:hypothetical protein